MRAYRSRRQRPCDDCRKRRIRCVSVREGLCATCEKLGILCTFKDEPVKRKRAEKFGLTQGNANSAPNVPFGASNALPLIDQANNLSSQMANMGNNVNNLNTIQPQMKSISTPPNGGGVAGSSSTPPGPTRPRAPPKVQVFPMQPPELEALVDEKTDPPLVPSGFDSAVVLGLSADQDPFLLDMYKYSAEDHTSGFIKHSLREVGDVGPGVPVQFLAFRDERNREDVVQQRVRITNIAGKFEARLLALFFQFVYPTYPIVDRILFFRDYYTNRTNINPGLLAGMLALSCVWWKYDAELCVHSIPPGLADSLYKECEACVNREIKYPTIATVQSLLLLLQRRLSIDETAETYAMTVEAARLVAVAHNIGLHLDCTNWSISPSSKRIRRRLWTTTCIMEKWTMVNCGSPLLLREEDSNALPYVSDEPSEQLFVCLARVTDILDAVIRQLYSVKSAAAAMKPENLYSTLAKVEHLFNTLDKWRKSLPAELQDMQRSLPDDFCRNGTLHLASLTVEVLLHRIRLRPQCMQLREYGQFRASASETIRRILVFTSEITHSHLHAFWYSASRLCFSTIAHFVYHHHMTSLTSEEFRATHEQLRRWLWALRVLAQGWEEGTGLAKFRLDTIFWMGNGLYKPEISNGMNNLPLQQEFEARCQQLAAEQEHQQVSAVTNISTKNNSPSEVTHHPSRPGSMPMPPSNHNYIDFNALDVDGIFDDLVINEEIIPSQEQAHLYEDQQPHPPYEDADAYAAYFDNWNQGVVSQQLHEILTEPLYDN